MTVIKQTFWERIKENRDIKMYLSLLALFGFGFLSGQATNTIPFDWLGWLGWGTIVVLTIGLFCMVTVVVIATIKESKLTVEQMNEMVYDYYEKKKGEGK